MLSSNSNEQSSQSVRLLIDRHDEDTFELCVDAFNDNFHVRGSALFSRSALTKSLATFSDYPIKSAELPYLASGYFSEDGKILIREHIAISVFPIDDVGGLIMSVKAFSPDLEYLKDGLGVGGRCDYRITYEGLNEFKCKLDQILSAGISMIEFHNFESRKA